MKKKRILVIGSTGLFGLNFVNKNKEIYDVICNINKKKFQDESQKKIRLNFFNQKQLLKQIDIIKPDIILNAAGLTDVKKCEHFKKEALEKNYKIIKHLIKISNIKKIKLIHISTDHIFDGKKISLYKEIDKPNPINFYAKTKVKAENEIVNFSKNYLIIRTNFFGWGASYRNSFTDYIIKNLCLKRNIYLRNDVYFNPMYLGNLIDCLNILILKNIRGIYNLTTNSKITKYEFGIQIAKNFNFDHSLIKKDKKIEILKPKNMALCNKKISKIVPKRLFDLDLNIKKLKNDFSASYVRNFIEFHPYGRHYLFNKDLKAVTNVLKSKNLTQGPKIEEFEEKICKYVGAKYAVALSSCSAGLHLACKVAGLNKTNKLITSPNTFVSSSNAALHCNSKVDFADIDYETGNISLNEIEKFIKKDQSIKAIMPVHFGGLPCDVRKIKKEIIKKKNIFIIEDAAHALGAKYKDGSKVGSSKYSDMTVFSFHPVKSIACGEGGIITTNNFKIAEELRKLRSHGIEKSPQMFLEDNEAFYKKEQNLWYYEMQNLGYHYRLTDIQAALGISQLENIDKFLAKRKSLAKIYDKSFSKLNNLKILQYNKREFSSNHLYVILIDFKEIGISKTTLMQRLKYLGIGTQVHYIPVIFHPYYKKNFNYEYNNIKNAIKYYKGAISIPLHYDLNNKNQKKIINLISELIK